VSSTSSQTTEPSIRAQEATVAVKVFVSSTYIDLKDHRQRVITQLRRAGYQVDPMEDWTSDADEPRRFSLDRLDGCQACVLLVGFRRGFVPAEQERSITQMEYDHALDRGIDVLPFLLDDGVPGWPEPYDDRTKDPRLKEWREYIGLHHGIERFTTDPASVDVLPAFFRWHARQDDREQVQDYLASIQTAHGTIRFLGLSTFQDNQDMRIDRLFVEPQVSAQPLSPEHDLAGRRGRLPLREAVAGDHRLVILGDPGSGKSTLVDWLAWQLADAHQNTWKALLGSRIPIPLILRDLRLTRGITWDGLLDAFLTHPIGKHLSREHLLKLMGEGHALMMLDGLDEVGDLQVRRDLRDAVQAGLRRFGRCPSLFTSRVVGYDDVPFHVNPDTLRRERTLKTVRRPVPDPFATLVYIAPFDNQQIGQFARNWYAAREADADKAHEGAEHLVLAVHRDQDTLRLARVPNLLTIMALIHRNRATLPNGKALLYEDIVQAYLKTIDEFRHITEYTDSLQDMKRWLGEVGFKMQQRRRARDTDQAIVIDGDTLRGWLGAAMAGTGKLAAADDVRRFLDIIKRRSGLMLERGDNQFAFTHLSFQEYFAAIYLAHWVLSTEWLLGEEVPHGTAAADLQQYAADFSWEESLVFLFELLAGETPRGKQKIREAVFGSEWSAVTGRRGDWPQTAVLLARLASDPHVNWDLDTQAFAVDRCLTVAAEYHQTDDMGDLYESATGILWPLLSGEPAIVHQRVQCLADRWVSAGIPRLILDAASISDLSPLACLTELQHLSLNPTAGTDLSPLARLTGLTTLLLVITRWTDLSPLGTLTGLRNLQLWCHEVPDLDLSPLARLTGLTTLWLMGAEVTDLSPLAGLTGLRILSLEDARVTDLSPLAGLVELQDLDLNFAMVADLSPLAGLTKLRHLDLTHTPVVDFSPLARLTELQQLRLRYTSVVDLSPLAGLTKLRHLDLTHTPVVDLAPLAELIGLTTLSLEHTRVTEDEVAKIRARLPGLKVQLIQRA
jgi:internalin A